METFKNAICSRFAANDPRRIPYTAAVVCGSSASHLIVFKGFSNAI